MACDDRDPRHRIKYRWSNRVHAHLGSMNLPSGIICRKTLADCCSITDSGRSFQHRVQNAVTLADTGETGNVENRYPPGSASSA